MMARYRYHRMISIIYDVKSRKDKKNPASEVGYWGAKAEQTVVHTMEVLEMLMAEAKNTGMHEVLMGNTFKPYDDYDKVYESKEDYDANVLSDLDMAKDTMLDLFPGKLHMHVSNGFDPKKQKWKGSAHFTVTGFGHYPLAKDVWERIKTCDWKEIGFDHQVYPEKGKQALLRLPYCKKPGDNRMLRRAEFTDEGDLKYFDIDFNTLADGLVTIPSGPKLESIYVEEKKPKKAVNDEDEDSDDEDEDWSNWTYEKALAVIERLADNRADTHDKRIKGICSIIHLGRALKKMRKFRELAHLFAKKDPDYSEDKTNEDWDYFKARKTANPCTFASLIKFANEDNPVMKEPEISEDTDIPLTYYDQIHEILTKKTTTLTEVKLYLMGCIRLCFAKGVTIWYQRSTDGWWRIENTKNFPFSDLTTNEKFKDTTLMEVMEGLKGTKLFRDRCMTGGEEFYPWYEVNDRPGIINTFHGWPHVVKTKGPETKAVKLLKDHLIMLFGEPFAKYFIGTLAKKLQNPRWRNHKLIVAFGKVGGEGKNLLERIISRVFGQSHVLTSQGTKDLLGEGEAGYNPGAECALLVFVNEAEKAGKSIVSNEKFKTWITENIQRIRRMRQAAIFTPNYGIGFMWTNHRDFLKADPAFLRRLRVAMCNDEKIWDKAYFDTLAALIDDAQGIQEIFDWLINYDVSTFDPEESPASAFLETLKADSLTPLQRYIVEVVNGERSAPRGDSDIPTKELYKDFQQWCSDNGMPSRKVSEFSDFTSDLGMIDIPVKQVRKEGSKPRCFIIRVQVVEQILQKMQRNQKWKLLHDEAESDE